MSLQVSWIDDVIRQHKKQLDEIKKNRSTIEDFEDRLISTKSSNKHMEITYHNDNRLRYSEENLFKNNMQRTELNTLDISSKQSEDDTGVLKAKLETKKLRMRELKKQFENVCEENILIKNKLEELENFKQISEEKIQKFENETRQDHNEREREYIEIIKQLEHDKARADDKLNKLSSLDHIKSQEIELMNQKIKDFEIILDENTNDYLQQIKYYKDEIEKFRLRQVEQEKFCDVLNYFFTKISTVISPSKEATNVCVPDVKTLQGKLIELENFIVKQINEKNNLQLKYSKVLDIGTKLSQNESLNNSHLDNIKTLNERIYDLTDENRFLREQLDKFKPCDQSNLNGDAREYTTLMKDTQKDNVFINNYSKEEKEDLIDNYKTLEHRICSLESEVKQKTKVRTDSRGPTVKEPLRSRENSIVRSKSNNNINIRSVKPSTENVKKKKKKRVKEENLFSNPIIEKSTNAKKKLNTNIVASEIRKSKNTINTIGKLNKNKLK